MSLFLFKVWWVKKNEMRVDISFGFIFIMALIGDQVKLKKLW